MNAKIYIAAIFLIASFLLGINYCKKMESRAMVLVLHNQSHGSAVKQSNECSACIEQEGGASEKQEHGK